MVFLQTDTAPAVQWKHHVKFLDCKYYTLHREQRHTFYEIMECQYSVKLENNFVWLGKQRNCKKISNYTNFYQNALKKLNVSEF